MGRHHDVIVIGAGPAGLSASSCLAEMGLDVLCLDEQARIGGQIYRNIQKAPEDRLTLLGDDYARGREIADRFCSSGAALESSTLVWQVEPDGWICCSKQNSSRRIRANYIIVATGAMERPMPFPGWTLPGVMGAGGANNLTKEAGLTPDCRVVLAGSGPLLLLEASVLIKKGVDIRAIPETTPAIPSARSISKVPNALKRTDFLWKGMAMMAEIRRAKIPHYKGVTRIRARGLDRVSSVEAHCSAGDISFDVDMLLVHFGVIPGTHIFRQAGCAMAWHPEQRYWYPVCDPWGHTSCERIFAAGDGTLVAGAVAAACRGELAALEAARCSGIIPEYERDRLAAPLLERLRHDAWPRPFVDAVYAPRPEHFEFEDDTVICRCENIRIKDIRDAVHQGVRDQNEIKIMTRAGMGPCQGRMCGPAMAEIIAAELSISPENSGMLNIRPPLKPIPLAEVAEMDLGSADSAAKNWLLDK